MIIWGGGLFYEKTIYRKIIESYLFSCRMHYHFTAVFLDICNQFTLSGKFIQFSTLFFPN